MLVDAHAHFCRPEALETRRKILTVFCGTDPETAAQALKLRGGNVRVSCGLHPWYADRWKVSDILTYIRQGDALGEIGLDSVWCDVDMDIQREVLIEQLDLAARLDLPVILHTKGMEGEIARIVAGYPVRKLVHWYSCMEHLERYLEQGCWFTVGPDFATNPAVQNVLRQVSLDRILTETDGLDAVAWALGRDVSPADIETTLRGELEAIAKVHGIGVAEAETQVETNLMRFLDG